MSEQEVKMPWAANELKNLVHISEVASGKQCNCTCLCCGTKVVAVKGEINRHHFRHLEPNSDPKSCSYSSETELHLMAKQVIKDSAHIDIPFYTISPHDQKEHFTSVSLTDIQMETYLEEKIPDISGLVGDERLAIEVAVTHPCTADKAKHFKDRGVYCIEFDLQGVRFDVDNYTPDSVRTLLQRASFRWVSIPPIGNMAAEIHRQNRKHQISLEQSLRQTNAELKDAKQGLKELSKEIKQQEYSLKNHKLRFSKEKKQLLQTKEQLFSENQRIELEQQKHLSQLERLAELDDIRKNNDTDYKYQLYTLEKKANELKEKNLELKDFEDTLAKLKDELIAFQRNLQKRADTLDHREEDLQQQSLAIESMKNELEHQATLLAQGMAESRYRNLLKHNSASIEKVRVACEAALTKYIHFKRTTGAASTIQALDAELKELRAFEHTVKTMYENLPPTS